MLVAYLKEQADLIKKDFHNVQELAVFSFNQREM